MADQTRRIENGATLPSGKGRVDIRLQGLGTRGDYGSETMEDRLMKSPPAEESMIP
jgi:hypothetical protein